MCTTNRKKTQAANLPIAMGHRPAASTAADPEEEPPLQGA